MLITIHRKCIIDPPNHERVGSVRACDKKNKRCINAAAAVAAAATVTAATHNERIIII